MPGAGADPAGIVAVLPGVAALVGAASMVGTAGTIHATTHAFITAAAGTTGEMCANPAAKIVGTQVAAERTGVRCGGNAEKCKASAAAAVEMSVIATTAAP
jgi:hypothetical protein